MLAVCPSGCHPLLDQFAAVDEPLYQNLQCVVVEWYCGFQDLGVFLCIHTYIHTYNNTKQIFIMGFAHFVE